MSFRSLAPISLGVLTVLSIGCSQKAPAPKTAEPADHGAHAHADHAHADHARHPLPKPAAFPAPKVPVGPRVETGSFVLEVTSPESELAVGKPGALSIALEGRGEWHVNQEYPIRIDLAADPGAGLQQQSLEKNDAKEFNEEKATFLASLEPVAAGDHEVSCDVSFALCTDENCVLERRTVAMHVKVE